MNFHKINENSVIKKLHSWEFYRYNLNNEIAITDMEAGIEHFGRGIEEYVDVVIIAVEPSYESINVALKIKKLAEQSKVRKIFAVINYIQRI